MKQNETNFSPIISNKKFCKLCEFKCCKQSDYKKHLLTNKHKKKENETFETKIIQNISEKLKCICGIYFNSRTTLWRHKHKCISKEESSNVITSELIIELIKNNQEMKNLILEQNNTINKFVQKDINSNTTTNNNTTNNNNAFNLNFFLNVTCKDAMNLSEFVSSIKLNLEDLENTGRQGYIKGISDIIVKNLNNLEQCFRPIHCSDMKREVLLSLIHI